MAQLRRNNAFPVQACFVVHFQDDAEQTGATMQRRMSFANSIEQVLLPCANSSFLNLQTTSRSWSLIGSSSDIQVTSTLVQVT